MQLRPSLKFIKLSYVCCLVLAVAIAVYILAMGGQDARMWALMAVPGVLALATVVRHIQRRLIKLTFLGDRLRYESGLLSKTTRTMELVKVQDVRVDQTFGQRLVNIGDLSFETAGGSSRIVVHSIDRPQQAADHILALAQAQRGSPGSQAGADPTAASH
jgi:membrane protein YdbS with pleckstrin-like domain